MQIVRIPRGSMGLDHTDHTDYALWGLRSGLEFIKHQVAKSMTCPRGGQLLKTSRFGCVYGICRWGHTQGALTLTQTLTTLTKHEGGNPDQQSHRRGMIMCTKYVCVWVCSNVVMLGSS